MPNTFFKIITNNLMSKNEYGFEIYDLKLDAIWPLPNKLYNLNISA